MKLSSLLPQDQTYWYLKESKVTVLTQDLITNVVVVGAGMAGLTAAQCFADKGCRVVVLEKNHCGSGASGKSSGFITPDSELSLSHFVKVYGAQEAQRIWEFVVSGVKHIQHNIKKFNIACDYQEQDTLVVANTLQAFESDIKVEYEARTKLGYSATLYSQDQLLEIIGSKNYKGGVSYGGSFGIQGYLYCLGMKHILQEKGVHIYEETPVLDIQDRVVKTTYATVKAQHIIVCADRYAQQLDIFADSIYQAQTFLMISAPLAEKDVKKLFPQRPFMAWDTDLLYQYFRLTGDNRLLLGGASLLDTYTTKEKHNNTRMIKKLINYFNAKFPEVSAQFDYIWPGLVGVSKDIFPIAGQHKTMPSVYCISAAAGLPWAAALGMYSAARIFERDTSFDEYFSPYRSYTLGPVTQRILGKKITFALSNYLNVG
jgi:gamma-glutamylputrescine oxidase